MPAPPKRVTLSQKDIVRAYYRNSTDRTLKDTCAWVMHEFGITLNRSTVSRILQCTRDYSEANIDAATMLSRYN
ncbi:hypothetical protein H310_04490 [Aphanomyces invadans]|uniref:ARS-binding protein 1 N-terminal domain-containing protein n=1 Tax=Aphanomyces invadans TaxID=157072 RepID=A0A024UCH8_9STRA|nr:hypothetical protein H310_04490 [Aphanomyces invadans]ETW04131.1 hypothetical protein H310_04490 [Aphanomyces invadans]|eukprot:XP_008867087.1 hypothetical protein H310_04490 [Aphanomyces invadans]